MLLLIQVVIKTFSNLGTYKSKDEYLSKTLTKYKMRELVYKDTIKNLENFNKNVLKQVLHLQDQFKLEKSTCDD